MNEESNSVEVSGSAKYQMFARDRRACTISICLVLVIAVAAIARELSILRDFYNNTAGLAAGTPIRPMGVAFALGITEIGAILAGILFSIPGVILSFRSRSWIYLSAIVVAFVLCCIPLAIGAPAVQHIVKSRGLVLEE